MLTVSSGFAAAIAAPSRMTRARVRLEVLDTKAWIDNNKQVTSDAVISRLHQLTNRVRQPTAALASLEPNYWRLDGSFVLPPEPGELPDAEIGWWSESLCDALGVFDPPQSINITCEALYNAAGITITFDPAAGEWAADFAVTAYDGSGSIIYSEDIIGNTLTVYRVERVIPQFQRVELLISRWGHGQRRARVTEIDFGLIEDYGEDKLIDLSLINELDPTSGALPAGELRFRLDNSDRRFNIMNPQGLHYFLQQRQRITADVGVEVNGRLEYAPAGIYYLNEWKSDRGTLTASFVARDLLDLLAADPPYRRGQLQIMTAYDLATDILDDAGVLDYEIDHELQAVQLSGCVPIASHRDALQLVAVASRAVVRIDRQRGRLLLERLPSLPSPVSEISLGNAYGAPSITLDPLTSAIDVEVTSYQVRGSAEVYAGTIEVSGSAEIWLEYNSPCQSHQVSLTGGLIENAEHFAYASRLLVSGSGTISISVTAEEMTQVRTTRRLEDTATASGEPTQTLKVSNPLVADPSTAYDVAAWLLGEAKQRLVYDADWRQNPALECGDVVTIEDEFGVNRPARISRQELSFAGYLTGQTRAKGGGN